MTKRRERAITEILEETNLAKDGKIQSEEYNSLTEKEMRKITNVAINIVIFTPIIIIGLMALIIIL
jgi:hypothetical protein